MEKNNQRVLWLAEGVGIPEKMKFILQLQLQAAKLPMSNVYFVSLTNGSRKTREELKVGLERYIEKIKPKMIVCNCEYALQLFTETDSLFLCRGGVYAYNYRGHRYDVLVIDATSNWHNLAIKLKGKTRFNPGRWTLGNDLQKLVRWVNGKQRVQPKFEYTVCDTTPRLYAAELAAQRAVAISPDIETHPDKITVVGYAMLFPDGRVHTYVIPFYHPFRQGKASWQSETDEIIAWTVVRAINSSPAVKILQNGQYDSQFKIKFNAPLTNYLLDTYHAWHSIYTEAPRKINFIASIVLDFFKFWKDEAKGDDEETGGEHKGRFSTVESWERYLRYNALDCYNTLLCGRYLLALLSVHQMEWARRNYVQEFSHQIGPCLEANMRGLRISHLRRACKRHELESKSKKRLAELRVMCDDPEFNPASADQVGHLIFKTLGGRMPTLRGKAAMVFKAAQDRARSQGKKVKDFKTDEITLKAVADQHPIIETYLQAIWDSKKPANNISKYCEAERYYGDRLLFNLNAGGTETGRHASKKHVFGFGTQVQNVPSAMRDYIIADEGFVFFEPDYSQSDLWFVAFESGDKALIANLRSGRDMHCVHGSFFFKIPYEEFLARYKAEDPVIAGEPTGLRYITKRIVHGKNYNMAGGTLLSQMGRKAAVAAAIAIGHKDASLWDSDRLANFCQWLLDQYDKMYPGIKTWQQNSVIKGQKNGNKITAAHGRTRLFFGNIVEDKNTQREAIAYIGQGGTAGNINRVISRVHYRDRDLLQGTNLMTQTHDSLLFQIPTEKLHEHAGIILTTMAEPYTINGETFVVPTDAKCGFHWGKKGLKYSKSLTLEELKANFDKVEAEYIAYAEKYGIAA